MGGGGVGRGNNVSHHRGQFSGAEGFSSPSRVITKDEDYKIKKNVYREPHQRGRSQTSSKPGPYWNVGWTSQNLAKLRTVLKTA